MISRYWLFCLSQLTMVFRSGWIIFTICSLFESTLSLTTEQYCFSGCNSVCYTLNFKGSSNPCLNEHFYKTNFYCAAIYCITNETNAAIGDFNKSCDGLLPSFEPVINSAVLETVEYISYEEALKTSTRPLNHAVIPDLQFYETAYDSVVSMDC